MQRRAFETMFAKLHKLPLVGTSLDRWEATLKDTAEVVCAAGCVVDESRRCTAAAYQPTSKDLTPALTLFASCRLTPGPAEGPTTVFTFVVRDSDNTTIDLTQLFSSVLLYTETARTVERYEQSLPEACFCFEATLPTSIRLTAVFTRRVGGDTLMHLPVKCPWLRAVLYLKYHMRSASVDDTEGEVRVEVVSRVLDVVKNGADEERAALVSEFSSRTVAGVVARLVAVRQPSVVFDALSLRESVQSLPLQDTTPQTQLGNTTVVAPTPVHPSPQASLEEELRVLERAVQKAIKDVTTSAHRHTRLRAFAPESRVFRPPLKGLRRRK